MAIKSLINLKGHLTAGKVYEVLERTDKEYKVMNDSNIPYFYPRISFAITLFPQCNVDSSSNNGGSTDYYKIDPTWKDCQDIIEARNMNFSQGNIFKSAFTFNEGRHSGTTYERELNKIIWFAKRELKTLKKK